MNDNYLVIDLDRCYGCRACEVACKLEFGLTTGFSPMKVADVGPRDVNGVLTRDFVPVPCQHCFDAPCIDACKFNALYRDDEGFVQLDEDKCTRCGLCIRSCPFGAIGRGKVNDTDPVILKCNSCFERRSDNWRPSCVQHCPGRALSFLNMEEKKRAVETKHSWSVGRVVYLSAKWDTFGDTLPEHS